MAEEKNWIKNKREYTKNYYRAHYQRYVVAVNRKTEVEMFNFLQDKDCPAGYIKSLIRADMEKR